MRLSLNGWPPVASHMASLILGVTLAHLSWRDEPRLRLPPRALVLSLPAATLRAAPHTLNKGAHVHLIRLLAGNATCRLSATPWTLLAREPEPIAATDYAAAPALSALPHELHADLLRLAPADSAAALPACNAKPKVTYGPPQ